MWEWLYFAKDSHTPCKMWGIFYKIQLFPLNIVMDQNKVMKME